MRFQLPVEAVCLLREQLQSKDRQIETLEKQLDKKDEQISNQHDRMRETNVLMQDLQKRLAIAPARTTSSDVIDAVEQQGSDSRKSSEGKQSVWTRNINLFSLWK